MKPVIRFWALIALLFAGTIYFGCQKMETPSTPPIEYANATISGRITDNNNIPVEGAVVKAGSSTINTDINGQFKFDDIKLDKNAGFIKVEKAGYFLGSRTITVNAGGTNNVTIQLIKKVSAGTFTAATGGTVTVSNGGSINFQGNSIVSANSNIPYASTVSVNAFFINPSASNFSQIMPGALRGINSSNQQTGLQSFGMMAVELTDGSGGKYQLASGKTAAITFPIPTGLQAQAPATIPLWSFDETTGLWKEEGTATKTGNNYVGNVSHFSFWNCDAPFTVVDFSATIKDQAGAAISNATVAIKTPGDTVSLTGYGITDDAGKVSGKIPANKSLTMQVFNRCGTLLTTQNIGPFTTTTDIGVVTVNNPTPALLTISGTVTNCTGGNVTNGFVNILVDGTNYRALVNNGNFTITISRCTATSVTAQILALDIATSQQGTAKNITVTSGNVNAGQLTACGVSTNQFINYTVNSASYSILYPVDSLVAFRSVQSTVVSGNVLSQTNQQNFDINFSPNVATGTTPITSLYVRVNNKSYHKTGTINATITEYGVPGEYIAGNFTGNITEDSTSNPPVPISCNFRVKRLQ